jgi:hypothetical protein
VDKNNQEFVSIGNFAETSPKLAFFMAYRDSLWIGAEKNESI